MPNIKIVKTDFLIIGSGIAGLRAGLEAGKSREVCVITKGQIRDTGTGKAQGGIAVALDAQDSPLAHLEDTLAAGAGLCDRRAVEVLVADGIERVKELINWGCHFDRGPAGFSFTREAAHRHRRILHVGDSTGAEIEKTLGQRILKSRRVNVIENTSALELVVKNNVCYGALALNIKTREITFFSAPATLLATGGLGQIFLFTTNPEVATGDGLALAWRSGAKISDLEFIQFHPTTLDAGGLGESRKSVPVFLISEAVRGEGAVLKNIFGKRFMPSVHKLAELAPRDVVARAIVAEMKKTKSHFVYLDLSHIDSDYIRSRFPMIYRRCLELNLDITRDKIPVSPAAHYFMGGVTTDLSGRTSVDGLFAAGEVADVGVHGANRLASNSLLDGLVFGYRAARAVVTAKSSSRQRSEPGKITIKQNENKIDRPQIRLQIKSTMWNKVGIVRTGPDLKAAEKYFRDLVKEVKINYLEPEALELANMALVSWLVTRAALTRLESRGAHYRTDYLQKNDRSWQQHLVWQKNQKTPAREKTVVFSAE